MTYKQWRHDVVARRRRGRVARVRMLVASALLLVAAVALTIVVFVGA